MDTPPLTPESPEPPQACSSAGSAEAVAEAVAEVMRATQKFPTWPTDPLHAAGWWLSGWRRMWMKENYKGGKMGKAWMRLGEAKDRYHVGGRAAGVARKPPCKKKNAEISDRNHTKESQ